MTILSLRGVAVSFGGPALLQGVSLQVESGERLCLVGRNGAGKSTLMKVINGEIIPDGGEVVKSQGMRVARLTQEVPLGLEGSVYDVVAAGLGGIGELLARYHHVSQHLEGDSSLKELERLQTQIEAQHGWQVNQQVERVLSRMQLDGELDFTRLSGGMKRRVLLARALVIEPDLLLLDEPTNHLDIAAIMWLEEFLKSYPATLLFITHDRSFIQNLATRIIELDRGQLTSWPGSYQAYLIGKQEALEVEARHNALFDKKLAQEEVWIRQGIKARRTRNEGRVRALKALREERRARRNVLGNVQLSINEVARSGKLVVELKQVTHRYDERIIINNFSTTIWRGDKIGIIGPNGSGKTTLLKILLGELTPQQGEVSFGTQLNVAYFDQLRGQLNEELSVRQNVAEGSDVVEVNGGSKHIMSYLQDFLFSPERANTPVKALSGGERNRLLLAKLFTKPANMLVMDEPTNDLDVETLELLEELVSSYSGTLLVVSHDREFLNNVVTSTLVFEGEGRIAEYVGGYDDWVRQRPATAPPLKETVFETAKRQKAAPLPPPAPVRKLSYKDKRELELLPAQIDALERKQAELVAQMGQPAFYQQSGTVINSTKAELERVEKEVALAYQRWNELEEK